MNNQSLPKITLGGIGGDSHSVGLILIKWTLEKNGFDVNFIGIQNNLKEVFNESPKSDFILISCMDGHSLNYLQEFTKLKKRCVSTQFWYLGGNPLINPSESNIREIISKGFKRVFTKYITVEEIIYFLKKDFMELKDIKSSEISSNPKINDKFFTKISIDSYPSFNPIDFKSIRDEVLGSWTTGKDALNIESNAEFLYKVPHLSTLENDFLTGTRSTIIQPRTGVPLANEQLKLFKAVIAAGAQVVSYQVDSYTRNLNYSELDNILELNSKNNPPEINGTPIINWGIEKLRNINILLPVPTQVRHSSKDPRLLAEISFGGGSSAFEGGAICYNIPYYKNLSLRESIEKWKYVDYLVGKYYDDFNIRLHREFFGVLTGTLIPPSLAVTTGLLESYLAARQGVKVVSVGFGESGNLYQDIATVNVINRLGRNFLNRHGFKDVTITATLSQHMGAFPNSKQKSKLLILGSAASASYSKPSRLITKSFAESSNIPTLLDNCESLKIVRSGLSNKTNINLDQSILKFEEELIESECQYLIENVFTKGKGDVELGIIKAFQSGDLDIPFAPSIYNSGKVITFRDNKGAIRYLDTGNLPIPIKNKLFYKEMLSERMQNESLYPGEELKLVQKDIRSIINGEFVHWPLDVII